MSPQPAGRERGMAKIHSNTPEEPGLGAVVASHGVSAWFVREVLPLEPALMNFLRRSWRNKSEVPDLRQDIYVRVYQAACMEIPNPVKPFVFTVARNLLINRIHHDQVVSIETVSDLDAFDMPMDEPGPDRNVIARQELRVLLAALERLPNRARDVIVMRKIEGLSRPEIAKRLGIGEATVAEHLTRGIRALTEILHGEIDLGAAS
jgi:RNA polymerase sigma factor (sigma-70 family)